MENRNWKLTSLVVAIIGMILLYVGAEALVKGAGRLALSIGLSSLVIGATVVAVGTSMPELVSSVVALFRGHGGDIALGNIIGSNIANIALVGGVGALVCPLRISERVSRRQIPMMIAISLALGAVMLLGRIPRIAGVFFLLGLVGYIFWQINHEKLVTEEAPHLSIKELAIDLAWIFLGLVLLVIGGYLFIGGAIKVAEAIGVSQRVIGLTLVAFGSSCPELATVIVAGIRKNHDLSIGNILGSNIFNILAVIGVCALLRPFAFSSQLLTVDFPVMLAFSFLLWMMIARHRKISRVYGLLLLAGYGFYIWGIVA